MMYKPVIFGIGLLGLCAYGALHPAPHIAPQTAVTQPHVGDRVYFAHRATACNDKAAFDQPPFSNERSYFCQGWVDPDTYGTVEEIDSGHYCIDTDGHGKSSCHWFYDSSFQVTTKGAKGKI